jgi:hypothetical protein
MFSVDESRCFQQWWFVLFYSSTLPITDELKKCNYFLKVSSGSVLKVTLKIPNLLGITVYTCNPRETEVGSQRIMVLGRSWQS